MTEAPSFEHQKMKIRNVIEGFDLVTGGGLPRGRTTVTEASPGLGKTVVALQTLVNGTQELRGTDLWPT